MISALLVAGYLFQSLTLPCWLLAASLAIYTLED